MKIIKHLFLVIGAGMITGTTVAQSARAQKATISLPTICSEKCKSTIENSVWKQVEGVQFIEVNIKRKNAKVTFLPDRISLDNIRLFIADLGYKADNEEPDVEAIKLLPKESRDCQLAALPPAKGTVSDSAKAAPKRAGGR